MGEPPHDPSEPHRRMWTAVLIHAHTDLQSAYVSHEAWRCRVEAAKFLCSPDGAWAQSRRRICDLVGVDEATLRTRAEALLAQQESAGLMAEPRRERSSEKELAAKKRRRQLLKTRERVGAAANDETLGEKAA